MGRITKTILFLLLLVGINIGGEKESKLWKEYSLPGELSTKQEIKSIPAGWQISSNENNNLLSSVTVYDGPPEDKASLVYDNETRKKNILTDTWSFTGKEEKGIWIECGYSGTNIKIKKELPKGIKKIRISYDKNINICGYPSIVRIDILMP